MNHYDVTALGELLIDFTESGMSEQGHPLMEANPGGAPCNVLAMLQRLGHKTAFIGKVGADLFGRQLRAAIEDVGICSDGLIEDENAHTTLAFIGKKPNGDRDFSFYRDPGADTLLTADEVNEALIENCRIFHFGTLSMTHTGCRKATEKAVELAKCAGKLVSFDPNIREPLWKSMDGLRECMDWGMLRCDILKISDNEIEWFTGESDYCKAAAMLKQKYGIPLILVSLGADGSMAFSDGASAFVPAFKVDTIETTGAGDCFCACVLSYVLMNGLHPYTEPELETMLCYANAAAALVTTRKGALSVMPNKSEIENLLKLS